MRDTGPNEGFAGAIRHGQKHTARHPKTGSDDLDLFQRPHCFHLAEYQRLILRPRTPDRERALAELAVRCRQLVRELERWRERSAA